MTKEERTATDRKIFGRKINVGDRSINLAMVDGRWLILFERPPTKQEGTEKVRTRIALSSEAMDALVQLYCSYGEKSEEHAQ